MNLETMDSHYQRSTVDEYQSVRDRLERGNKKHSDPNLPMVSIVTTTFNSCETLKETIESIRNQDYPNWEYIVIDANSKDGTEELIQANRDIVTVYCREPDNGIYDGINKGVSLADGDIVKITNADDLMEPDSISRAVAALQASDQPERAIVNSHLKIINQASEVVDTFTTRWILDSVPAFLHPSWYVPASVYKEFGLYSLDLKVASDYEYYLYIRQACEFITLEEPLVSYRTDGRSSGFEGMREAIEISRKYLPKADADKIARTYRFQKIRKKVIETMFGKKGFYWLKKVWKR